MALVSHESSASLYLEEEEAGTEDSGCLGRGIPVLKGKLT